MKKRVVEKIKMDKISSVKHDTLDEQSCWCHHLKCPNQLVGNLGLGIL